MIFPNAPPTSNSSFVSLDHDQSDTKEHAATAIRPSSVEPSQKKFCCRKLDPEEKTIVAFIAMCVVAIAIMLLGHSSNYEIVGVACGLSLLGVNIGVTGLLIYKIESNRKMRFLEAVHTKDLTPSEITQPLFDDPETRQILDFSASQTWDISDEQLTLLKVGNAIYNYRLEVFQGLMLDSRKSPKEAGNPAYTALYLCRHLNDFISFMQAKLSDEADLLLQTTQFLEKFINDMITQIYLRINAPNEVENYFHQEIAKLKTTPNGICLIPMGYNDHFVLGEVSYSQATATYTLKLNEPNRTKHSKITDMLDTLPDRHTMEQMGVDELAELQADVLTMRKELESNEEVEDFSKLKMRKVLKTDELIYTQLKLEDLSVMFLKKVSMDRSSIESAREMQEFIDKALYDTKKNNRQKGKKHKVQSGSHCYSKAFTQWLHGRIPELLWRQFKYFMSVREVVMIDSLRVKNNNNPAFQKAVTEYYSGDNPEAAFVSALKAATQITQKRKDKYLRLKAT